MGKWLNNSLSKFVLMLNNKITSIVFHCLNYVSRFFLRFTRIFNKLFETLYRCNSVILNWLGWSNSYRPIPACIFITAKCYISDRFTIFIVITRLKF